MLLDCSFPAVRSGLLAATCAGALQALEKMKDEELMHMAVIAFDSSVYFFNVSSRKDAPEMIAAPDIVNDIGIINDNFGIDKIELPCETKDLIVPVKDAYNHFKEIFEKLPSMFAKTIEVDCAFGPALTAAISLLNNYGGKIITTLATLPTVGEGKLKSRLQGVKEISPSKEHTYCLPATDFYKERGLVCSKAYISVDIVTNCNREIDLASIAPLARLTSGTIYNASPLDPSDVTDEVEHLLTRFMAFESIMRIRCSRGVEVTNVYGHCHVMEKNLIALAVSNEDATYSFEFKLTPEFKDKFAYVQFAVIYTSRNREKIFRCHTLQFPIVETLSAVINSANSIGVSAFLTKMCIDQINSTTFVQACQSVSKKMEKTFTTAFNEAKNQHFSPHAGCLYIPESMRYVPQILNGFFRSIAVGIPYPTYPTPDERVAMMARVVSSSSESMLAYYLGWNFEVFVPSVDVNVLPSLSLSSGSFLDKEGIFLINLGFALVLFCGVNTHPLVVQTFGLTKLVNDAKKAEMKNRNASIQGSNNTNTETPELSSDVIPEELIKLRTRVEELLVSQKLFNKPAGCVKLEACAQLSRTCESNLIRMMTEDLQDKVLRSYTNCLQDLWTKITAGYNKI